MSSAPSPQSAAFSVLPPREFRRICSRFATGVAVLTVRTPDGKPHGLTVNSFTSVSLHPPLILVCVDERSSVLPYLAEGACFGVNFLAEGQTRISQAFAGRQDDRFEGIAWTPGSTGVPLLDGTIGRLECEVVSQQPAGDHSIVLAAVRGGECHDGKPLLYFSSGYARLPTIMEASGS